MYRPALSHPARSHNSDPVGSSDRIARSGSRRSRSPEVVLDQYYTREDVAAWSYHVFQEHFDPAQHRMVEPSAGTGAFFKLLPLGSWAFDIAPKYPGIWRADYLTIQLVSDRPLGVIGNPPFGKNASMAVRFFNHAARHAMVIAYILPKTFRKASIQNRLNPAFHLLREENMPDNAFLFRSRPYDVPTVFQIWERRSYSRELHCCDTCHPDFEFTTADRAHFAVQRLGMQAGRVHHDLTRNSSSHYFIKGDVEHIMRRLDFASVTGNVAGHPSLAKAEIVRLYREWMVARENDQA